MHFFPSLSTIKGKLPMSKNNRAEIKAKYPVFSERDEKLLSSKLRLALAHNEGIGNLGNSSAFKIIQFSWAPSKTENNIFADAGKC